MLACRHALLVSMTTSCRNFPLPNGTVLWTQARVGFNLNEKIPSWTHLDSRVGLIDRRSHACSREIVMLVFHEISRRNFHGSPHVRAVRPSRRKLLRRHLPGADPASAGAGRTRRRRRAGRWRGFQRVAYGAAARACRQARRHAGSEPRRVGRIGPQRRTGAARLVVRHAAPRGCARPRRRAAAVEQHALGGGRGARTAGAARVRHRLPARQPVGRGAAAARRDAGAGARRGGRALGLRSVARDRARRDA